MNSEEVRKQIEEMEKDLDQRMVELARAQQELLRLQEYSKPCVASDGSRHNTPEQLQDYEDRLRLKQIHKSYMGFDQNEDHEMVITILAFHFDCDGEPYSRGRLVIENDQDVRIAKTYFEKYFDTDKPLAPGVYYLFIKEYNGSSYGSDYHYVLSHDELKQAIAQFVEKANGLVEKLG